MRDEVGDLVELRRIARCGVAQRLAAPCVRLLRQLAGAVEAELGHVGALAEALIAAAWLARAPPPIRSRRGCRRRSGRARPARWQSFGTARLWQVRWRPSISSTHSTLARIKRPGLELMHVPQALGARWRRGGHIEVLAADHAVDAGRARRARRRRAGCSPALPAGGQQVPERLGVEPVAGEDRDVLAEGDVAGRVGRGAGRRHPSPAGRRGSASRCGSARAPPPAADARPDRSPIAAAVASASTGRMRLPPASSE